MGTEDICYLNKIQETLIQVVGDNGLGKTSTIKEIYALIQDFGNQYAIVNDSEKKYPNKGGKDIFGIIEFICD